MIPLLGWTRVKHRCIKGISKMVKKKRISNPLLANANYQGGFSSVSIIIFKRKFEGEIFPKN